MLNRILPHFTLVLVAGMVAGCAETEFVAGSVKRLGGDPDRDKGIYKVGKPYVVNGAVYRPHVDYNYSETGIASWYGPDFHGKRTANGEVFDMNEISAAHKTLPLPSMVRITNLENGRVMNVRVNDRGPFSRGRIIDVSRRTAQLLGFEQKGTSMVRVEILARESQRLAAVMTGAPIPGDDHPKPNSAPRISVTSKELAPLPGMVQVPPPSPEHQVAAVTVSGIPVQRPVSPPAEVDGQVKTVPVSKSPTVYVQVGAYSQYANAHRRKTLLDGLAPAAITQVQAAEARMFRVRLGPVQSVAEADALLSRVIASGVQDARIVVD